MEGFGWLTWTVLLFIGFVAVIVYVYRGRSRKSWQNDAEIPFRDAKSRYPDKKP